jgi:hypothetical protein
VLPFPQHSISLQYLPLPPFFKILAGVFILKIKILKKGGSIEEGRKEGRKGGRKEERKERAKRC